MFNARPFFILCTLLLYLLQPRESLASTREEEIAQCLAGEMMSWGDGRDRAAVSNPVVLVYDHRAAPTWFSEGEVFAAVQRAANSWARCGVPAQVGRSSGTTGVAPGAVTIRWSDADAAGNFGLAHFGLRWLVLGPAAFQLLRTRNPAHDARETLQMVISHEMGHLFGLMSHSRRCVDVTSSYHNGKGERCMVRDPAELTRYTEYRAALPTACDIQRCRQANGFTFTP
jgi:hypothetical protein